VKRAATVAKPYKAPLGHSQKYKRGENHAPLGALMFAKVSESALRRKVSEGIKRRGGRGPTEPYMAMPTSDPLHPQPHSTNPLPSLKPLQNKPFQPCLE